MDGREVHHVEAEVGQGGELGADPLEATPRAREHLVPGAEGAPFRVDVDLEGRCQPGDPGPVRVAIGGRHRVRGEGGLDPVARRGRAVVDGGRRRAQEPGVGPGSSGGGPVGGGAEQEHALGELPRQVGLAGGGLALDLDPQDARSSAHASMVHSHRPGRSTGNEPSHRTPFTSASMGWSGASDHVGDPGPRQQTTARSTSWPSRKMSAPISTRRPTDCFAG